MNVNAFLPVGKKGEVSNKTITRGDILELATGEKVVFLEMRRTKFIAKDGNRNIQVPVYRDRMYSTPYIAKVLGRDESVVIKTAAVSKFKPGQLFALEGHKETFMFLCNDHKKGGRPIVKALDIASKKTWNIAEGFTFLKIDLNELKKEIPKYTSI